MKIYNELHLVFNIINPVCTCLTDFTRASEKIEGKYGWNYMTIVLNHITQLIFQDAHKQLVNTQD